LLFNLEFSVFDYLLVWRKSLDSIFFCLEFNFISKCLLSFKGFGTWLDVKFDLVSLVYLRCRIVVKFSHFSIWHSTHGARSHPTKLVLPRHDVRYFGLHIFKLCFLSYIHILLVIDSLFRHIVNNYFLLLGDSMHKVKSLKPFKHGS
jgi:hypothetical protein